MYRLTPYLIVTLIFASGITVPGVAQIGEGFSAPENILFHQNTFTFEERVLLKAVLTSLGYQADSETGQWDEETDLAVRMFQQTQDMIPDGRIGAQTLIEIATVLRDREKRYDMEPWVRRSGRRHSSAPTVSKVNIGETLKYLDFDSGKFKYGKVVSVSGNIVVLYDDDEGTYVDIDMEDIE